MKQNFTSKEVEYQHALIGEFVVKFESLSGWMRFLIPKIIIPNPTSTLEHRNLETLMEGMTAEPLRSKFSSLLYDNLGNYEELIEANQILSSKIQKMISIRNTIVHGEYRIGWSDFQGKLDRETLSIRKSKSTKDGYKKNSKILSTETIKKLIKELYKMTSCFNLIAVVILLTLETNNPEQVMQHIEKLKEAVNKLGTPTLNSIDTIN